MRTRTLFPAPYAHGYMFNTPAISNDEINESTQNLADVTIWNPSWGWTAGSAISTLHDLEIWAKALASGKLLSPATQKERLTWTTTIASDKYGLAIADFNGFIGHNGQLPGYQCFEGYMPEKDATIVVLTNLYQAPDGSKPADTLAGMITSAIAS